MYDLALQWGGDLAISPTGDIALISGSPLGQQRVLRRLMTNPGDYIWQLDYGAGLGQFIGQPSNISQIEAVIRSQIFKESAVARTPEPNISIELDPSGGTGTVYVQILYVDAPSGQTQVLSFSIGG
jgi:phage baseplate assembly protein W